MESAREAFAEYIRGFEFSEPKIAVYTNVTGQRVSDPKPFAMHWLIRCILNFVLKIASATPQKKTK